MLKVSMKVSLKHQYFYIIWCINEFNSILTEITFLATLLSNGRHGIIYHTSHITNDYEPEIASWCPHSDNGTSELIIEFRSKTVVKTTEQFIKDCCRLQRLQYHMHVAFIKYVHANEKLRSFSTKFNYFPSFL